MFLILSGTVLLLCSVLYFYYVMLLENMKKQYAFRIVRILLCFNHRKSVLNYVYTRQRFKNIPIYKDVWLKKTQ